MITEFWGVVATDFFSDFFKFFLGLIGAILVAFFAVQDMGRMRSLIEQVQMATTQDVLSFGRFKSLPKVSSKDSAS